MTTYTEYGSDTAGSHITTPSNLFASTDAMPQLAPVRVCEPMSVVWNGVDYSVASWDVHGFKLAKPIPTVMAPGKGRVFDASLLIGQGITRIQLWVQCRQTTGDETGQSYQFVDLDRAQAELLHRIVGYAVTKQELSLTQLLNDTRETRTERQETVQRMLTFRTWFQVSLAVAALGGAAYMMMSSFTTVTSRYAAVSAAAVSVSAPAAGMVTQIDVATGMPVTTGQILGYLRPPDHDQQHESLHRQLRALEAEQAELRARRAEMERHLALDAQLGTSTRARLKADLARMRERLALERAQLSMLEETGLPTMERQQARSRQRAIVIGAESDLAAAQAALQDFEAAHEHGLALARGATAQSSETLDLRFAYLTEEIALAYARAETMDKGVPVTAPCDCEVSQINRVVGEWAEPAQPLFVMAAGQTRNVEALIMAEDARHIREGARAEIRLMNGTRAPGQVTRVSYDTSRAGVAGLNGNVFAAERYARVEVKPDQPLDAAIGLTGTVSVRTRDPIAWLTRLVGG